MYGRIFAKKVSLDGYTFDSQMEADYYLILKDTLDKHCKDNLEIHPKFKLQDEFIKRGITFKAINYEADFLFYDMKKDKVRVIDIKGMVLPEFEIHRKLFEFKYPQYDLEVLCKIGDKFLPIEEAKVIRKENKKKRKIAKRERLTKELEVLNAKPKLTEKQELRKTEIMEILYSVKLYTAHVGRINLDNKTPKQRQKMESDK